jgi:hypothetical protein
MFAASLLPEASEHVKMSIVGLTLAEVVMRRRAVPVGLSGIRLHFFVYDFTSGGGLD